MRFCAWSRMRTDGCCRSTSKIKTGVSVLSPTNKSSSTNWQAQIFAFSLLSTRLPSGTDDKVCILTGRFSPMPPGAALVEGAAVGGGSVADEATLVVTANMTSRIDSICCCIECICCWSSQTTLDDVSTGADEEPPATALLAAETLVAVSSAGAGGRGSAPRATDGAFSVMPSDRPPVGRCRRLWRATGAASLSRAGARRFLPRLVSIL